MPLRCVLQDLANCKYLIIITGTQICQPGLAFQLLLFCTPEEMLFSPAGRLKIAFLQLIARLLPGRFAVWLSLLDEAQLERQVQIKSGPSLKPIFELLRRLDRDLVSVRGRIQINILEPDHIRTLTLALNDDALCPVGSFFDVDVPRPVLDHILSGELDLSGALLRGRIRVGGDTGLAARLVNAPRRQVQFAGRIRPARAGAEHLCCRGDRARGVQRAGGAAQASR